MSEVETPVETARVVMLWPKETKDTVRQLAGARGITAFTLEAVNAKIEAQYGVVMAEVSEEEREALAGPHTSIQDSPVQLSEAVTPLPHDRYAEAPKTEGERQRVIENLRGLGLKSASEITPPAKDDEFCTNCGAELVDGECWSCT